MVECADIEPLAQFGLCLAAGSSISSMPTLALDSGEQLVLVHTGTAEHAVDQRPHFYTQEQRRRGDT